MNRLTIGQMSIENGVSKQTLRLYDNIGLFTPIYRDDETGYRYYDVRQSAKLDIIQYFKSIGLSLNEIKEHLAYDDMVKTRKLLELHISEIDEKMKDLNRQRRFIQRTIENLKTYENKPPSDIVFLEKMPDRYIYLKDLGRNFYNKPLEVYEMLLREFKKEILNYSKSLIYFNNIGTIIRKDNILQRNIHSTEFFIFLQENEDRFPNAQKIDGGYYLCIYCYTFDDEINYINKLLKYVEDNGFNIIGDYICEVLADIPELSNTSRGMFIRLQIPISFV